VARRIRVGEGGELRVVAAPQLLDALHRDEALGSIDPRVLQQLPEVLVPDQEHVRVHVELDAVRGRARCEVAPKHRLLLVERDLVATLGQPKRRRDTREPGAGDGDPRRPCHGAIVSNARPIGDRLRGIAAAVMLAPWSTAARVRTSHSSRVRMY
jgi:hypothetical protein